MQHELIYFIRCSYITNRTVIIQFHTNLKTAQTNQLQKENIKQLRITKVGENIVWHREIFFVCRHRKWHDLIKQQAERRQLQRTAAGQSNNNSCPYAMFLAVQCTLNDRSKVWRAEGMSSWTASRQNIY